MNNMQGGKQSNNLTGIVYDEFDQFNRTQYYEQIDTLLLSNKQFSSKNQMEEEKEHYAVHMRTFFHTSDILTHQKNSEFFQEVIRQLHPTVKIKTRVKDLLKVVSKVYVQELAQACKEQAEKSGRADLDSELIGDGARVVERRRSSRCNVGGLLGN